VDLITTVHVFLKMLEQFCQKDQRHLIVQKVKSKRRKAKKKKSKICFCTDCVKEINIKLNLIYAKSFDFF